MTFHVSRKRLILTLGVVAQPEIVMQNDMGESFLVMTYQLPFSRGHIHRIRSPPGMNRKADAIFRAYQEQAATGELDFRRFPLRAVSSLTFS